MADSSPPPSPHEVKQFRESKTHSQSSSPITHPTLPRSAINKKLFFDFPTPPQSPNSPTTSTFPRGASPRSASFSGGRRPSAKHIRNDSRSAPAKHTRRRSSLSAGFHMSDLRKEEYGPPPHPAPTTPLPPVPGAPRIPYTTPAQERNRYSSYELMDKLRILEQQQKDKKKKRHSAPPLRVPQRSLPSPTVVSIDIRRTVSDTAAENDGHAPQLRNERRRSRGLRIISTGTGNMEVDNRI